MKQIYLFKRLFASFVLLLMTTLSWAYNFEVDGICYNINSDGTSVTVTYKGTGDKYSGAVVIPETVTYDSKNYDVTSIGTYAFRNCSGLTSITIPESVTSIGNWAFEGCTSLPMIDNIRYADTYLVGAVDKTQSTYNIKAGTRFIGTSAFYWCSGLTSITIPNSVTSIGYQAFYNCSGLTSITIPDGVTSIGDDAFWGCSGLKRAEFASIEGLCEISFSSNYSNPLRYANHLYVNGEEVEDLVIPESVTSIGRYAFSGCSGLTSVTIPESVTSIDGSAFSGCSGLTSVTINSNAILSKNYSWDNNLKSIFGEQVKEYNIGNSVTSIGDRAFGNCSSLTSVTIPNSVTSIGKDAFYGCTSLPVIDNVRYADTYLVEAVDKTQSTYNIKAGTRFIGFSAFSDCSGLTSINIPNSVTSIGQSAFSGCSDLTSITIPDGVTNIGSSAFSGCSGLTSVTIPESVTSIGSEAFAGCSGLTTINIPEGVTSIGWSAFYNCSSLTSTTIPNSVTSIDDRAFSGCSGLTSVTIGNSVTSIGSEAFAGCSDLTSLTIGSGVKTVGKDAFYGINRLSSLTILCQNADSWFKGVTTLKDLVLGNGVESIADEAFSGCSELTTISIGNGIKSIGTKAFANCGNIYDVYCYAMRYPTTSADAFENSYPDYITLHVPDESVDNYKAVAPWSTFKKVVGISSDSGREACEKPVLTYKDGKLEATSETEGAQCVIIISDEDINTHFNSVNLTATYHINAYATKPNYKNSEIVTATLCWIDQEPETEGLINDVAEVRALPVLIQSEGGVISVNGINSGTEVRVYSVNGIMAGSANATDNSAQIDTNLLPGSIAIVKIGKKSVKIVMK